jgi:tRNA1(Val) A37 N6-methylase TrmN6
VSDAAALPPHTIDSFLGGRVTLMQPQKGHRAGLDAALLQAVIPADASGLLIDIGAGVGTVAFAATARAAALAAVAVERDPDLIVLAREALTLPVNNGFAGRVRLMTADATDLDRLREGLGETAAVADWVLMNPPFDTPDRVRQSPDAARRKAHVGSAGLLEAWCRTAAALLRPGGTLGLIHRGEALPTVLQALSGVFGDVCVLPAYPSEGAAASRIVVRAERASRAPFRLLAGLVLHRADGAWTDEADAILRGRAALAF